jgi:hypothetical protein
MTIPTPQPRDDGPPFQPQAPVRWFNPAVLARAGLRVLLAAAFGTFLDKRDCKAGSIAGSSRAMNSNRAVAGLHRRHR